MFVINRVEQRVFQHIEKIRNLKHKNTVGLKHVTYTGDDAAEIIDMGANIVGRDNLALPRSAVIVSAVACEKKSMIVRGTGNICFRCDFLRWINALDLRT